MIVQSNEIIYSDLDTFFYNCSFRDDNSNYSYGCSHKLNNTNGQCLDSGCPFLWKLDKDTSNKDELNELFRIDEHLYIEWDYENQCGLNQYPYIEQREGWREDTIVCCDIGDFHIFDTYITVDIQTEIRKYITRMGIGRI